MRRHIGILFCFLPLLLTCAPNGKADVILTNGGFEDTGSDFGAGLFTAAGWTDNSSLPIQASSAPAGFEGTDAAAVTGSRYLRLVSDSPDPDNTGFIVQDLGTMVSGQIYTFTGDILGGAGTDLYGATVQLTSDGSLTPATVYSSQALSGYAAGQDGIGAIQVSYVATSADNGNELFLSLRADPTDNATRGGIDNIQLTVGNVPEPAGVALFSLGLVGLGFLRRRR